MFSSKKNILSSRLDIVLPWLIVILNLKRKLTLLHDLGLLFVKTSAADWTRHTSNEILRVVLIAFEKIGNFGDLLEHERTRNRSRQYPPLVVVVYKIVVVHDGEHDKGVLLFVVDELARRPLDRNVAVDVAKCGIAVMQVGRLDAESRHELEKLVRVKAAGEMERLTHRQCSQNEENHYV